jgi:hypothetical protein
LVGFTYTDSAQTPHGIFKMILQAGEASTARITVGAKSENISLPKLGGLALPVRAQLQAANGECWEAVYGTAVQTASQFKAKAD